MDADAAFISNHIKRGHNYHRLYPMPIPDLPLNLDLSPGHYDHFSPPWLENEQNTYHREDDETHEVNEANEVEVDKANEADKEVDDEADHGTPLHFPSSPPSPTNSFSQTPAVPLSSPSGSDYYEKAREDEQERMSDSARGGFAFEGIML